MRKIDQGELRPEVQQVFPLEEVVNAHGALQTGHVCGKLVLSMNGDAGEFRA